MAMLSAQVQVPNGDLITLTWIDPLTDADYTRRLYAQAEREVAVAVGRSIRGLPVSGGTGGFNDGQR